VPIDSGKGPITPSEASIIDGSYTPLSRPLFIYVNKKAYDSKSSVKAFVDFALGKTGAEDVKESNYVALPTDAIDAIKAHLAGNKTGTVFADAKPGMTIQQVLAKETSAK
jgi:phosphate transport system substrate-binding protein